MLDDFTCTFFFTLQHILARGRALKLVFLARYALLVYHVDGACKHYHVLYYLVQLFVFVVSFLQLQ